jgi:hypothetical protein
MSLGRLDDGDLRERFVSARRGSGRVSWKFRAGRRAGRAVRVGVLRASRAAVVRWRGSQARARRAREEPARRARGEPARRPREGPARRARRRRTKPVRDTAFAGAASRSRCGVRFMPTRVRRALDGTLDPARRPPSASLRVWLPRPGRPSAMARAISRRMTSRTTPDRGRDQTPKCRPDREVGEGELAMTPTV